MKRSRINDQANPYLIRVQQEVTLPIPQRGRRKRVHDGMSRRNYFHARSIGLHDPGRILTRQEHA